MNIGTKLSALRTEMPAKISTGVALGTGQIDGYSTYESPLGEVIVTFNPDGVSSVGLAEDPTLVEFEARFGRRAVEASAPRGWDVKINRAIEVGTPGDLPVDTRSLTEFQRSVLETTATIPHGQVRPYGWLATQVGNPGAVRAVGSTMARNPVPLIIPCHRVVRSDGRIGNYSLGGAYNKSELLSHEGIDPEWLEHLASRHVRFIGSNTTGIFCHPTCSQARRITDQHRVDCRSIQAASEQGFRPCKLCTPA